MEYKEFKEFDNTIGKGLDYMIDFASKNHIIIQGTFAVMDKEGGGLHVHQIKDEPPQKWRQ